MLPGVLALVRVRVELAEAEVAVGDEGANAELGGPVEGFEIVSGRWTIDTVPRGM
jgi:hypothetical protein